MIIREEKQFKKLLKALKKTNIFVFDTETTGLDSYRGNRIIGKSIFIPDNPEDINTEGLCVYLPFRHKKGENLMPYHFKRLAHIYADTEKATVGFNLRFDISMLRPEDVMVHNQQMDVMLAAHLVNENEMNFRLKSLSDKYLSDKASLPEKQLMVKLQRIKKSVDRYHPEGRDRVAKQYMMYLAPQEVAEYAKQDVILTWKLLKIYTKALEHQGLLELWLQINKYAEAVTAMENRGILISLEKCRINLIETEKKCEELYRSMVEKVGYEFNPRSQPQVSKIIGQKETNRSALQASKHPMALFLEEHRRWTKAKTAYFERFFELTDIHNRIHPSLNMIGTVSGRLSCKHPNLQALPRQDDTYRVREVVVAPVNHILLSADYNQIELRILAHYTDDSFLINAYKNEEDIHQLVADRIKMERWKAKRINFGIVYGMGVNEAMLQLKIGKSEASLLLKQYHAQIPGIKKLYYSIDKFAQKNGFIELWTGRRRHFGKYDETWKAMSNLIQGGVAEVMRIAITKLHNLLADYNARMIMQVHDEILFEIPENEFIELIPKIRQIMEDFMFKVNVKADLKIGLNWGEMKLVEESELMPAQKDLFEGE